LFIPDNLTHKFRVKEIFSKKGFLQSDSKISIVCVLMPLIMSFALECMNMAYVRYHLMLYEDFNELLSPFFTDEEISTDVLHVKDMLDGNRKPSIFHKLIETMTIKLGMFPLSNNAFHNHQFVDIIAHIRSFGSIKGFWEMSGERTISALKKKIVKGWSLILHFNLYVIMLL
jgi:hypothetical protein